ncbi:MAG: hypothetical protein QME28_02485, partial [Candidatus Saccharicenans sp.]|nr:hypothetical protein [Candidatus Saccharicenans sp.]
MKAILFSITNFLILSVLIFNLFSQFKSISGQYHNPCLEKIKEKREGKNTRGYMRLLRRKAGAAGRRQASTLLPI